MKDPVKVLHFMKHEVACAAWAGGPPGVHSQVSMGTVSGIISLGFLLSSSYPYTHQG